MAKVPGFNLSFKALDVADEYFYERLDDLKQASTQTIREAADYAKDRLRTQVRTKFRNRGKRNFANAFNAYAYPDKRKTLKDSLNPAMTLQANPTWAEVFEEGAVVTPRRARFLAVPTKEAEELGLDTRPSGRNWDRRMSQTNAAKAMFGRTFTVKTGKGLFVAASRGGETVFLFSLVKSVRIEPRISLYGIARDAFDRLPRVFDQKLDRATR